MRYAKIKYCDIADGVGARTSLFVSGCRNHCPGCFNEVAWDFAYGDEFDDAAADAIIESMRPPYVAGLSLLGGDPMEPENQAGLVDFCERVRAELPTKTIWCYTGYAYEDLLPGGSHWVEGVTDRLLGCIDILVDGPWVSYRHDITLRFRGSSNQRIIDLVRTRQRGTLCLWSDEEVYASHTM